VPKFTLVDDKTEINSATMRLDGQRQLDRKRLHLHDAGADRKDVVIDSTAESVVVGSVVALFDGRKGIWTVDLLAKAKGKGEIQAKLKGAVVAKVAVEVTDRLDLPGAAGEEGLLARLLLVESISPEMSGYEPAKSRLGMQWMRVVLANRLTNPGRFLAPGATTIKDIVKAKNQFEGFEKYPTLTSKLDARLANVVKIANDDNDPRQDRYARFLRDALEVAASKALIQDPCPTGLYGWRTAGSSEPGGGLEKWGDPLSGNQYYTLKK
jgi:hypothetical protein